MAMRSLLRVHKEIENVNADFHSLRTVLKETEDKSKWNFVMFPNDGALSHLPLIGELVIPERYPDGPPVLHLFTRTMRMNVDAYRYNVNNDEQSTMCFDILRSKTNGGTWQPVYTLSCLFASLMQALVSQRVPQDHGGEYAEFVSMEKLGEVKRHVRETYCEHKDRFPLLPTIPTIPAVAVAAEPLVFTRLGDQIPVESLQFQGKDIYVSQAIYLQDPQNARCWSTMLDLRNLHPGVVFSVILSNKIGSDFIGKESNTILLRNGVTGTAAKKRKNKGLGWFYHGKPLNDQNLSVCVTINNDQFVMAYKDDDDAPFLVHGDTPISKLGKAEIGNVSGMPFYLNIFMNRKSGPEGFINVLNQENLGFIHSTQTKVSNEIQNRYPVSVKLVLDGERTARLQGILDVYNVGLDFQVQRNVLSPAHQTLICGEEYPREEYIKIIDEIYAPLKGKSVEINVTAIIADKDCAAFLTEGYQCPEAGEGIQSFPDSKLAPLIMRLRNDEVKRICGDELARRVTEDAQKDWVHVGDTFIQLPQPIKVICQVQFEY